MRVPLGVLVALVFVGTSLAGIRDRTLPLELRGTRVGSHWTPDIRSRPKGEIHNYSYGGLLTIDLGRRDGSSLIPAGTTVTVKTAAPLQLAHNLDAMEYHWERRWRWRTTQPRRGWIQLRALIYSKTVFQAPPKALKACYSVTLIAPGAKSITRTGCVIGTP